MADAGERTVLEDHLRGDEAATQERVAHLEQEYSELLADSGVIQEDRDTTLALLTSARHNAAAAREAVERFEAGTYGRCASCGDTIPSERLEAMPGALLCVSCSSE